MSAAQVDIDIFINKAQSKIASLGDSMLLRDTEGLDVSFDVNLIEELYQAIYLLQNRSSDFTDTKAYELISYLNYKANLTVIPTAVFDTVNFSENVLLPGGGYLVGPPGPQGLIGPTGLGTPGADGTNGADGKTVRSGSGAPSSGLGVNGDFYINTAANTIYGPKTSGAWGSPVSLIGADGTNGTDGTSSYTYIAYASASDGTGFTMVFNSGLDYIAIKTVTSPIVSPSVSDFAGLWYRWKGTQGDPFKVDAQGILSGRNTYDTQVKGFTYLATDTGDIYIKNSSVSGDWSGAISFVGDKGWSPVYAVVSDGARRVMKLVGWTGGAGPAPIAIDLYLSNTGLVSDIASATDIRGDTGKFIINAQDVLANRTTYDDEVPPFVFYATDTGNIYFKLSASSGDWSAAFPFRGPQGVTGDIGSAGVGAFTATNGSFTQPAVASTVSITVLDTSWIGVGQVIFIETAGYYHVDSIGSGTTMVIKNLGYPGSASPTTVIATAQKVSAAGIGNAGSGTWGAITGVLSDQTDLQAALDAKVDLLTGDILFNFRSSSAFDITNDGLGGDYSKGYVYFDSSEVNFGWGLNYMATGSITGITFRNGGGTISMPTATGTLALISDLTSGYQPLDSDLTTIAGLIATTNNFIVAVAGAWASRTPTQVKSTLAIANTDVSGLGTLSTQNGTFSGTSSGTNTGDQDLSGYALIASTLAGYGITDAYTKTAGDARYLLLSGGTLTGALTLNADASSAMHAVTYQQLVAAVAGVFELQQGFDASLNLFPTALQTSPLVATIKKGFVWNITVAGTLGGTAVTPGDVVTALIDNPGTTAGNWVITSHDLGFTPVSNVLTSAYIFVGNGSNVAAGVAVSGDITISNAGVTAIGAGKVTNAMLAGSIAYSNLALTGAILNADLAGSIDLTTKVTGILPGSNGGTGVNNSTRTITISGNLATTGAFNLTIAVPRTTTYTLPNTTSETLAGLGTAQTFSVTQTFTAATSIKATLIQILDNDGSTYREVLSSTTNNQIKIGNGYASGVIAPSATTVFSWTTTLVTSFVNFTMTDAKNIATGTTTGTILAVTASQRLGIWGASPVTQPNGAAQAAVATTAATNTSPYGFTTQAQADAIVTLVNKLRSDLVSIGIIKGSA